MLVLKAVTRLSFDMLFILYSHYFRNSLMKKHNIYSQYINLFLHNRKNSLLLFIFTTLISKSQQEFIKFLLFSSAINAFCRFLIMNNTLQHFGNVLKAAEERSWDSTARSGLRAIDADKKPKTAFTLKKRKNPKHGRVDRFFIFPESEETILSRAASSIP